MAETTHEELVAAGYLGGESEPYTTAPTTQIDLAIRQAKARGEDIPTAGSPRSFAVEGNEESLPNYLGVSQEYQGFGDPTQAPLRAEDGPEAEVEARAYEAQANAQRHTARTVTGTLTDGSLSKQRQEAETPSEETASEDETPHRRGRRSAE